jgi:hypothetical protein
MVAGGQGQAPADVAVEVGQGAAGVVQHVEDLIGARQQGAAGFGQADFAAHRSNSRTFSCDSKGEAMRLLTAG